MISRQHLQSEKFAAAFEDKVRGTIKKYSMLQKGDSVAVGFSGGADSTALLYVLHCLSNELELTVRAIHVNHGIRGASAQRDEDFARRFCAEIGVELHCFRADIPALAEEMGVGLEECGRIYRYRCFAEICQKYGGKTATAHTLSDCAETLLFNVTRGSGISGLRAIPPVRDNIIRPLIRLSREDIEAYCKACALDFVTDESNYDTDYSRNLLRLEVVPRLKSLNPAFLGAVERLAESAAEDESFLCECAKKAADEAVLSVNGEKRWSAQKLMNLPAAVRRRAIIHIIEQTDGTKPPEYSHVRLAEEYMRTGEGAVMLQNGIQFCVRAGEITIRSPQEDTKNSPWQVPVQMPETMLPDGRTVRLELFCEYIHNSDQKPSTKKHKLLFKNVVACDIINNNALIRSRCEGDRFSPAGRGVTKKLKKLFCEDKIPADMRDRLAVLESDGKIIWVEGYGVAEGCSPAPEEGGWLISVTEAKKEN